MLTLSIIFTFVIMNMVMKMKHIFILRPDTNKDLVNQIVTLMQGRHYELCYTKDIDDARIIASRYNQSEELCRLYAVGGDGFVHKVANGMMGSYNQLVVIPQGTGNDFARSIYCDLNPMRILKNSLTGQVHPIDIIKCKDDLYCINVFCCGLDAEVGNIVNVNRRNIKYLPRTLHYGYTILDKIFHLKFYPTQIEHDGMKLFDGEVVVCAFCNGKYFGGGYLAGYESKNDDGFIDMTVIGNISKKELPRYVKALITNRLNKTKKYQHFSKKYVTVKSSQYVNIDGEMYEPGTYHLECLHNALQLVCEKEG